VLPVAARRWVSDVNSIREEHLDIVAILETGRTKFSASFLKNLSAGKDFIWFCLPSHGRSGGILVGVNAETLLVKDVDYGDFLVRVNLRTKKDGFEWSFVAVYGAAQEAHKSAFLAELVRICDSPGTPMIIGGDFNILRSPMEKSTGNYNAKWPIIFNAIIDSLNLRELIMSGRQFTWASRRQIPTYEKLDRVLASVEWEHKYPLASVRALTRTGSDHTPLLLDSGEQAHSGNNTLFSFELSWLREEGFF
jgi:hypothetical protein